MTGNKEFFWIIYNTLGGVVISGKARYNITKCGILCQKSENRAKRGKVYRQR